MRLFNAIAQTTAKSGPTTNSKLAELAMYFASTLEDRYAPSPSNDLQFIIKRLSTSNSFIRDLAKNMTIPALVTKTNAAVFEYSGEAYGDVVAKAASAQFKLMKELVTSPSRQFFDTWNIAASHKLKRREMLSAKEVSVAKLAVLDGREIEVEMIGETVTVLLSQKTIDLIIAYGDIYKWWKIDVNDVGTEVLKSSIVEAKKKYGEVK
jgi:hypothetical protein